MNTIKEKPPPHQQHLLIGVWNVHVCVDVVFDGFHVSLHSGRHNQIVAMFVDQAPAEIPKFVAGFRAMYSFGDCLLLSGRVAVAGRPADLT